MDSARGKGRAQLFWPVPPLTLGQSQVIASTSSSTEEGRARPGTGQGWLQENVQLTVKASKGKALVGGHRTLGGPRVLAGHSQAIAPPGEISASPCLGKLLKATSPPHFGSVVPSHRILPLHYRNTQMGLGSYIHQD